MKKPQLSALAVKRKIKISGNKDVIMEALWKDDNKEETNNDENNNNENLPPLGPLVTIIQQSFLQPLPLKSDRLAANIGHKNEVKFLKEFWNLLEEKQFDLPDGTLDDFPELCVVFRPGLVSKKGDDNSFVKDSADGVFVFKKADVSRCTVACVPNHDVNLPIVQFFHLSAGFISCLTGGGEEPSLRFVNKNSTRTTERFFGGRRISSNKKILIETFRE